MLLIFSFSNYGALINFNLSYKSDLQSFWILFSIFEFKFIWLVFCFFIFLACFLKSEITFSLICCLIRMISSKADIDFLFLNDFFTFSEWRYIYKSLLFCFRFFCFFTSLFSTLFKEWSLLSIDSLDLTLCKLFKLLWL